jgi:hypothetical protein
VDESTLWSVGTIAGLAVLGGALGAALVLTGHFDGAVFASVLFGTVFLSSGMAMQLYRRGADHASLVGGLAGFAATFAFFATPIAVRALQEGFGDPYGTAILLVVAPLVAGGLCAGGTLYLVEGVKRYRARNGMVHAPK